MPNPKSHTNLSDQATAKNGPGLFLPSHRIKHLAGLVYHVQAKFFLVSNYHRESGFGATEPRTLYRFDLATERSR